MRRGSCSATPRAAWCGQVRARGSRWADAQAQARPSRPCAMRRVRRRRIPSRSRVAPRRAQQKEALPRGHESERARRNLLHTKGAESGSSSRTQRTFVNPIINERLSGTYYPVMIAVKYGYAHSRFYPRAAARRARIEEELAQRHRDVARTRIRLDREVQLRTDRAPGQREELHG